MGSLFLLIVFDKTHNLNFSVPTEKLTINYQYDCTSIWFNYKVSKPTTNPSMFPQVVGVLINW